MRDNEAIQNKVAERIGFMMEVITADINALDRQFNNIPHEHYKTVNEELEKIRVKSERAINKAIDDIHNKLMSIGVQMHDENYYTHFLDACDQIWSNGNENDQLQKIVQTMRKQMIGVFATMKIYVSVQRPADVTLYTSNMYQMAYRMVVDFLGQLARYPHENHTKFAEYCYLRMVHVHTATRVENMTMKLNEFADALDKYGQDKFHMIQHLNFDMGHIEKAHQKPLEELLEIWGHENLKTSVKMMQNFQEIASTKTYSNDIHIFPVPYYHGYYPYPT